MQCQCQCTQNFAKQPYIFFVPKVLRIFFLPLKNTLLMVKNSKMSLNHIFWGHPVDKHLLYCNTQKTWTDIHVRMVKWKSHYAHKSNIFCQNWPLALDLYNPFSVEIIIWNWQKWLQENQTFKLFCLVKSNSESCTTKEFQESSKNHYLILYYWASSWFLATIKNHWCLYLLKTVNLCSCD